MKRVATGNLIANALTPFVVAGILVGLWLALVAAYENMCLAKVTSQILTTVGLARADAIDKLDSDSYRATYSLLEKLSRYGSMNVNMEASPGLPYMDNPWSGRLTVVVQPVSGQIWLETPVSGLVCRRLMSLFTRDVEQLGFKRADVFDVSQHGEVGKNIFNAAKSGGGNMKPEAIRDGCGPNRELVVLKLTFGLK
jgi:hypothetical protein